jgi:predicted Rossmann fold nucleotide-binding protein DprA/Smf involved in DNA uptake
LSNRVLLEEMKVKRKEAIEQLTKSIKETQNKRRLITTELKKGALSIRELETATGLSAKEVLMHLIALRKAGEISEVDEKDGGYLYAMRRGK